MQGSIALTNHERIIGCALILSAFALLSSEHLFHYPIAVLTLLGVYQWIRQGRRFIAAPDAKRALLLFVCIYGPMLLALADAVAPRHTLKTTAAYIHFLPALLYAVRICREPRARRVLLIGVAGIVWFWSVDALWQLATGRNLFGFEPAGASLTGIFHANQRLGLVLALFLPLAVFVVHKRLPPRVWWWLLLLPLLVVVLFSLKRSAWVMLILGLFGYGVLFVRNVKVTRSRITIAATMAAVLGFALVAETPVRGTLQRSLTVFSSDFETIDMATSRRLTLWRTASFMARQHPINGIGPRGYRHVYRDYAAADDFWLRQGAKGQTHPHLMGLEVLVETGLIGLIGLFAWCVILMRHAWRSRIADPAAANWSLLALVAWFPLNTHLAFYGSYWSSLVWLLVALAVADRRETAVNTAP